MQGPHRAMSSRRSKNLKELGRLLLDNDNQNDNQNNYSFAACQDLRDIEQNFYDFKAGFKETYGSLFFFKDDSRAKYAIDDDDDESIEDLHRKAMVFGSAIMTTHLQPQRKETVLDFASKTTSLREERFESTKKRNSSKNERRDQPVASYSLEEQKELSGRPVYHTKVRQESQVNAATTETWKTRHEKKIKPSQEQSKNGNNRTSVLKKSSKNAYFNSSKDNPFRSSSSGKSDFSTECTGSNDIHPLTYASMSGGQAKQVMESKVEERRCSKDFFVKSGKESVRNLLKKQSCTKMDLVPEHHEVPNLASASGQKLTPPVKKKNIATSAEKQFEDSRRRSATKKSSSASGGDTQPVAKTKSISSSAKKKIGIATAEKSEIASLAKISNQCEWKQSDSDGRHNNNWLETQQKINELKQMKRASRKEKLHAS